MSFSITNKLFPSNHKTVFVLDHTPYFGISCESPVDLKFLEPVGPDGKPLYMLPPITPWCKTLWTCSVESAIEYCRIVWDLFPQGKLVRFVASDSVAHILNTWSPTQQNLSHIMNAMSLIGVPPPHGIVRNVDYTVLHGLRAAVEALSECTDIQAQKLQNQSFGDLQTKLLNRCRVICITSARDNDSMKRLEELFLSVLHQQNNASIGTNRLLIDHCHLVILNTFPVNTEPQVSNHPPKNLSPMLTTEVHSINATRIADKLSTLILEHYSLGSTTVMGIPMKEEQGSNTSNNYDVEIFHSSEAHAAILKGNAFDSSDIRAPKKDCEYETVSLKWCTPRVSAGTEMQNCIGAFRITPVEVNARQTLCLINFLLNGRSVMLEMPKKSGGKITSHLLAAHGGEVFIHTLCTARSVLEDPPSISEGCGGRVTDYRITDFGLLIKQNTLVPLKKEFLEERDVPPLEKMKTRLNRHTKYWPMTISSTLIFNLKGYIDPLPSIITKEKITEEEVFQCKRIIYNLIALESKNESLYPLNTGQRVKGQKREDQYKAMWNELETLLKKNLHSPDHRIIYNCLLDCHKGTFDEEKLSEKVELDEALRELDHIGPSKSEIDAPRASVIRATTDSPMSPPPLASINPLATKASTSRSSGVYSSQRTLLDIFTSQEKVKSRPEFNGRLVGGTVAKLYANHKHADSGSRGESMEVE